MAQREHLGLLFEFFKFRGKPLVRGECLAQAHEGTHDIRADFDGAGMFKTEAAMSAPCSVNAKGARRSRIFAPGLDITGCDLQSSNSL